MKNSWNVGCWSIAAMRIEVAPGLRVAGRTVLASCDMQSDGDPWRGGVHGKRRDVSGSSSVAPDIARRQAIETAETAIEVGEIAESDIVGDGRDRHLAHARLAQQPVRPRQPL